MGKENNLHEERFRKFMNYLKDHKAEIKLVEDGYSKTYYCSGQKNENKLKSLIEIALNVEENIAYNYSRPNKGLGKSHTNRKKVSGIGNFIDAIHLYSSKEHLDEIHSRNLHPGKFWGLRVIPALKTGFVSASSIIVMLEDYECKNIDEFYDSIFLGEYLKELSNISNDISISGYLERVDHYPFNDMIDIITVFQIEDSLEKDEESNLNEGLDFFIESYFKIKSTRDATGRIELIPGYTDYFEPTCSDLAKTNFSNGFDERFTIDSIIEMNTDDLILNRYQILHKINDDQSIQLLSLIGETKKRLLLLLILTRIEFIKLNNVIQEVIKFLLDDILFMVFSSANESGLNHQQHGLDFSQIAKILTDFNFDSNLSDTFNFSNINILNRKVQRFPEPQLVINKYSNEEIKHFLIKSISGHFRSKIINNLNIY